MSETTATATDITNTIYDFSVAAQDGSTKSLAEYRNKVLLVVNTATGCGFTPQYTGLEALYQKYHNKGFEILDFPCNQFAGQAPGSDQEIHEFCVGRFAVTFPQFSKIKVNGKDADPLYAWLKSQNSGVAGERIKWNFTKFLIDRSGHVVDRFAPQTTPEEIDDKIAAVL